MVDAPADPVAGHSILRLIVRLMSGALLSKMLGFVREIVMALIIGTALAADSFRTAITAVLLPISFFQAETVPAILIPMQKERLCRGAAPQGLAALTLALGGISVLIMFATQLAAAPLVDVLVGGFSPEGKDLTVRFVEIMALAMPASVILNCLAAGEIALGRARVSNARAAMQNMSVLIGLAAVALGAPVIVLAWAFSLSFNALTLVAILMLRREGNIDFNAARPHDIIATMREFFRRLGPLLPLPMAEQLNIWLERLLTSRLQGGAVASLDYARTLTESFLLLISQPVGLAVLSSGGVGGRLHFPSSPQRGEDARRADEGVSPLAPSEPSPSSGAARHLLPAGEKGGQAPSAQEAQARTIVRVVLAFSLPASAFLFLFAEDIVTVVFHRGAFGATGVMLTSHALEGISLGLWASTLGWILLRLLNGAGRSGRAAFILVLAYAANMAFNTGVAHFHGGELPGLAWIGFGESVRALVLLAGVLLSLRLKVGFWAAFCLALIPAGLVLAGGDVLEGYIDGVFARLLAGGAVLGLGWLLAAALLVPGLFRFVLRRRFRVSPRV
ncbi:MULTISPECIES: lipid II flippase MurJ [unclassified Rhizobium]|uniref:lipid II flippase MurJ n=1 Tax=unclassified Rhizobium TaxID=2613769 RepID=UPI0006F36A51|nr:MULTISPECIES: lipid II flippase MurJ [unclassified Rhizobium]KQV33572.1 hypothetical protein ASC86_16350 [Rhizobium sp. Root1212]KRD23116.1 hypothetical protein ASE37_16270 [Rhizobium sp. Root268]